MDRARPVVMRLYIIIIGIAVLFTNKAGGCSVWNEGKSCNCECEDISIGCRAKCHDLCVGGCHGTIEIINQGHCYDKCHKDFQECINSC